MRLKYVFSLSKWSVREPWSISASLPPALCGTGQSPLRSCSLKEQQECSLLSPACGSLALMSNQELLQIVLFPCMLGPDRRNCPLPGVENTFTASAPSACPLMKLKLHCGPMKVLRCARSWKTATKRRLGKENGLWFFSHVGVVPFQIFFQPIRNHFGRGAGKNGLECSCQHLQGSEVLRPRIAPWSHLCPLQMFIKVVSQENTASLSRKQQSEHFLFDFHSSNKSLRKSTGKFY